MTSERLHEAADALRDAAADALLQGGTLSPDAERERLRLLSLATDLRGLAESVEHAEARLRAAR